MSKTEKSSTKSAPAARKGCGCAPAPTTDKDSCCDLIGFQRPNYFCGHLLTDRDLALDQQYVIEKNKLRNRSLFGCGVVCGLRLSCDPHCPGSIRIGEGYAIDDCGNDIVVPASRSFDVVGLLKKKGLLIDHPAPDPCKPEEEQPECHVRQCFYVTICYEEYAEEFTTPFVSDCRPVVTDCEHTRVREGARLDVVSERPDTCTWESVWKSLSEKIECCRRLFTKSHFATALREECDTVSKAVSQEGTTDMHGALFELFCKLRGLLLLYLKKQGEAQDCRLSREIEKIPFPTSGQSDQAVYAQAVAAAYKTLIEAAHQHVMSCITATAIFPCPEPCCASCVLLGTVEVENGEVVRVCNCPRTYVWSFATLPQVLVAHVLGGAACEQVPSARHFTGSAKEEEEGTCCAKFELDVAKFIDESCNPDWFFQNAQKLFVAAAELKDSFQHAVDFRRSDALPFMAFQGLEKQEALERAKTLGVVTEFIETERGTVPSVIQALARFDLPTKQDRVALSVSQGHVQAMDAVTTAENRIAALEQRLAELTARFEKADSTPKGKRGNAEE